MSFNDSTTKVTITGDVNTSYTKVRNSMSCGCGEGHVMAPDSLVIRRADGIRISNQCNAMTEVLGTILNSQSYSCTLDELIESTTLVEDYEPHNMDTANISVLRAKEQASVICPHFSKASEHKLHGEDIYWQRDGHDAGKTFCQGWMEKEVESLMRRGVNISFQTTDAFTQALDLGSRFYFVPWKTVARDVEASISRGQISSSSGKRRPVMLQDLLGVAEARKHHRADHSTSG